MSKIEGPKKNPLEFLIYSFSLPSKIK